MEDLRIGVAKKDITPSLPIDLAGYIRRFGKSKGIHDPLQANFLTVNNGAEQVLFVSLDILFMSDEFSLIAKDAISGRIKIERKNILIASTHTHSAPGIHLFRDEGLRDKNWEENVLQALLEGAAEASQSLKKANIGMGMGFADIGKNRRKQGGPKDTHFPIVCFFDERRLPIAIISNYGCHPVVLDEKNLLVSSDYVHYFRNSLNQSFSSDVITLFFTGATGDVDPIERGNFSIAENLGAKLAEEALKVLKKKEFKANIEIQVKEAQLKIPYGWIPNPREAEEIYKSTRLQYSEALRKKDKKAIKIQKAFILWAEEIRKKASENKLPHFLECSLQSIRLGDAAFLAFPFELFSSISLSLRAKSRIKNLFMVGYANGYRGYLPDEISFSEGGYEVEEAFKYVGLLPFSPQAEKLFIKRALFLLENQE